MSDNHGLDKNPGAIKASELFQKNSLYCVMCARPRQVSGTAISSWTDTCVCVGQYEAQPNHEQAERADQFEAGHGKCTDAECEGKTREGGWCRNCRAFKHTACFAKSEIISFQDGWYTCQWCHHVRIAGPSGRSPVRDAADTPRSRVPLIGHVELPEFAGRTSDDPRRFVHACRERLNRYGVPECEWANRVSTALKGDAKTWWQIVQEYDMPWTEFARLFEARFADVKTEMRVRTELYCLEQGATEAAEAFIMKKIRLYKRLFPGEEPTGVLERVVELMRPEFRPYLRPMTRRPAEEFVQQARVLEQDLRAVRPTRIHATLSTKQEDTTPADTKALVPYTAPTRDQARRDEPGPSGHAQLTWRRRTTGGSPPPQCHTCPPGTFHWHENCPVRNKFRPDFAAQQPSGNGRQGAAR
ncbi:uncharacterized protein LOC134537381 [Bacillus rossius redtenbacheri]|uniref:uncharacterized protein LOC134537381 n=1 Tax=Bacillus rossius redtenbacheri TaxID=93214 RepID=UPI002FDD2F72